MMYLLFLAIALVVAVAWFLVRPLAAKASLSPADDRAQLQAVRERLLAQLQELDTEVADAGIDEAVAADERQRLEAELAEVLRQLDQAGAHTGQTTAGTEKSLWAPGLAITFVALALLSGVLYLMLGQPLTQEQVARPQVEEGEIPPMVKEMITRLETRLAEQPQDPEGWSRLGRSYQVLGRFEEASRAYARAYEQAPDNGEILAAYAMFLFQQHPGVTEGKVLELFNRLHQMEPTYPAATWFLGLAAYQRGDFPQAVSFWEKTVTNLPADSPALGEVQRAIEDARQKP